MKRKRSVVDSEQDNDSRRPEPFNSSERSEAARPYSLGEKARLHGGNSAGGEFIGLGGAFARVTGKRNITMDASPTVSSTDGQGPSPGLTATNEKHGIHDTGPESTPTSSAVQQPLSAHSAHEAERSSHSGASLPSPNDQAPQTSAPTFRSSLPTTRPHPPSMMDVPPTYTAADPTSALWVQRIQLAAAIPSLQQMTSPSPPVPSNRDAAARVQMDPELD